MVRPFNSLSAMEIERGNTQDGVNVAVIDHLGARADEPFSLLDVPSGQGSFLRAVRGLFPRARVHGVDLFEEPFPDVREFFTRGSSADWSFAAGRKFDVITCISGVMCFDNISDFFRQAGAHLNPGGRLIVTNDNVLTVRDRLSFLFFGRVKRFKKIYAAGEGNWNVILVQALWKLYRQNGFTLTAVHYTSRRPEDYLFAPLALVLYPFELFHLCTLKSELPLRERLRLFPPSALISRHYVMVGVKDPE